MMTIMSTITMVMITTDTPTPTDNQRALAVTRQPAQTVPADF
jgi:hypothetical protein